MDERDKLIKYKKYSPLAPGIYKGVDNFVQHAFRGSSSISCTTVEYELSKDSTMRVKTRHFHTRLIPVVLIRFAIGLASFVSTIGCKEVVHAPSGLEEPFSIYGVLNPSVERQTLLVAPIEPLLYNYSEVLDAFVTSMHLASGETIGWSDSVIRDSRGVLDHVFTARFTPEYSSTYRIEVLRSDGATTAASVLTPPHVNIRFTSHSDRYVDIHFDGDSVRVHGVEVIYVVRWNPRDPQGTTCAFERASYSVPYIDKLTGTEGQLRVRLDLLADYQTVFALHSHSHGIKAGYQRRNGLALLGIEVKALVVGPNWLPETASLDGTLHSFPGANSNVENGFGIVAAAYTESRRIVPDERTIESSPFHDYLIRTPIACSEYCMCY